MHLLTSPIYTTEHTTCHDYESLLISPPLLPRTTSHHKDPLSSIFLCVHFSKGVYNLIDDEIAGYAGALPKSLIQQPCTPLTREAECTAALCLWNSTLASCGPEILGTSDEYCYVYVCISSNHYILLYAPWYNIEYCFASCNTIIALVTRLFPGGLIISYFH